MVYRVLFGMIPMVCIWLFLSGAIPVTSVIGVTGGVDNVSERVEEDGKGEGPRRRRTPEGMVSEKLGVMPPGAIDMMEDNMRAVEEMEKEVRRMEDDERRGIDRSKWEPRGGGWGRQ